MRPLKLRFFGIGSYAGEQELDFEHGLAGSGLFLIHGATGAGKTTILDAITYALYGEASGQNRDKNDTLRADRAPEDEATWAELTFSLGAARYRVYRSLKHQKPGRKGITPAKAELYRTDDEEVLMESAPKAVTQRVTELIGIDHAQFCQVVLLPQGDFQKFLVANSQERSNILQKLFRTERYSAIEERLKKRAASLEKEAKSLREREMACLEQAGCATPDALDAAIAAGAQKGKELEKEEASAAKEAQKAQAAHSEGKALAERFAARDARAKEFANLREKLPTQQEFEQKLQDAEHAALPIERESRAQALRVEAKARREAALAAEKARADAETAAERAEAALKQEEAREGERDALRNERANLTRLAHTAEAYGAAEREMRAAQEAKANAEGVAARLAAEAERAASEEKVLQAQEAELAGAAGTCALCTARVQEMQQKADLAAKILRHTEAVRGAESARARAEEAAEREERTAKESDVQADRLRVLYRMSAAFSLAEHLAEGEPCPVCGATHHPKLAEKEGVVPTKAELEQAERAAKTANERASRARGAAIEAAGEKETVSRLLAEAQGAWQEGDALCAAARAAALAEAEEALKKATKEKATLADVRAKLAKAQEARARRDETIRTAQDAVQAASARYGAASGRIKEMEEHLSPELRAPDAVKKKLQAASAALAKLEEALSQAQANDTAAKEASATCRAKSLSAEEEARKAQAALADGVAEFRAVLGDSGLTQEAYEAIARDKNWSRAEYRREVAAHIQAFSKKYAASERAVQDAEKAIAGAVRPDVAALCASAEAAQRTLRALTNDKAHMEAAQAQLKKAAKEVAQYEAAHAKADAAYRLADSLASVATGERGHGVHFQTYVQQSIFCEVMDAANARLAIMSRQRFQLVMGDRGQDQRRGRGWEGLELAVLDAETGKPRGVRSLSGGESFLASLSLALGLADVVQAYAGGVRLDTMFIDEGFGSLDMETLDTAIEALIALQKDGARLVGIISHVTELEARIPARLEVERGAKGSHAYFAMGVLEA